MGGLTAARRGRAGRLIGLVAWTAPASLALLLDSPGLAVVDGLLIISLLCAAFGAWAFLTHGGPQITAPGVFCAGVAVFVGYSGWWWIDYLKGGDPPTSFYAAVVASYFATVLTYFMWWWPTRVAIRPEPRDQATALWAANLGLPLAVVALIVNGINAGVVDAVTSLSEDAAFVGVVLFAVGLSGSGDAFRLTGIRMLLLAALVAAFVGVAFDGFGRLPIIALGAAVATVVTAQMRRRSVKILTLIATPIASSLLTALRNDRLGIDDSGGATGPDSDVGGIWTFARLVDLGDAGTGAWGETFWGTVTIWVPRDVWASKPVGFGTELTALLEPQLLPAGHSMVSTVFGEFFFNFGWAGLPILVVTVGPLVAWLDRIRGRVLSSPIATRRAALVAVLLAALTATMTDFVWSGTHTFAARMLVRVIVILGLLLVFGGGAERWQAARGSHTPRRAGTRPSDGARVAGATEQGQYRSADAPASVGSPLQPRLRRRLRVVHHGKASPP